MKKSILLIAVLAAFSFASCKKDQTCVCTNSGVELNRFTVNTTKKKAKDQCSAAEATYSTPGAPVTCEIK